MSNSKPLPPKPETIDLVCDCALAAYFLAIVLMESDMLLWSFAAVLVGLFMTGFGIGLYNAKA